MFLKKNRRQRGDTIVEVLIAVIVLSTILASAYVVASRSYKENQQTQEHAQALQVAQAQLETLRATSSRPAVTPFCFDSSGNLVANSTWPPGTITDDASTDTASQYPRDCKQAPSGGSCTGAVCYRIAIRKGLYNDANLYTVTVRWDGINGGTDQVRLDYRLP